MTPSLRSLGVVLAAVVVLAVAVAVDLTRVRPVVDRAIAPGFAADGVTALVWPGRGIGGPDLRVVRDARSSTGWAWAAPAGEAERRTVDDVLAALRGARWQRRAEPTAAGTITARLIVESGGGRRELAIGARLGDDQQWIVTGDRALLVDRWVVDALVPSPVALRITTPLARAPEVQAFDVTPEVAVRGAPRRIVRLGDAPAELLAHPGPVGDLERALAELAVIAVPATPVTPDGARTISLDGALVVQSAGACPGHPDARAVTGPRIGAACVARAAWEAVERAAAAFDRARLSALVDPRPAPIDAAQIRLRDGGVLELARRPRIGDRDADPTRLAELLAVLATPGELVALPALPAAGQLEVRPAAGAPIVIELYRDGVIARRGEPIGIRVGNGSWAVLARGARSYRDPTLWREDPTTIHAITVGATTYTRGAVLGEWTGPAAVDARAVDALVARLAAPRALDEDPGAPPAAPRTIAVAVQSPAGAGSTHELAVGRTRAGCAATIDATVVLVEPEICALAARL